MNDLNLEPRGRTHSTREGCEVVERWRWNEELRQIEHHIELSGPKEKAPDDTQRTRRARSRSQQ